jgi:hypothetical protein
MQIRRVKPTRGNSKRGALGEGKVQERSLEDRKQIERGSLKGENWKEGYTFRRRRMSQGRADG